MECPFETHDCYDFGWFYNEAICLAAEAKSIVCYISERHNSTNEGGLFNALCGAERILDLLEKLLDEESERHDKIRKTDNDTRALAAVCKSAKAIPGTENQSQ